MSGFMKTVLMKTSPPWSRWVFFYFFSPETKVNDVKIQWNVTVFVFFFIFLIFLFYTLLLFFHRLE